MKAPLCESLPHFHVERLELVIGEARRTLFIGLIHQYPVATAKLDCAGHRVATADHLFVEKAYRGMGIGTFLIQTCFLTAREAGCESLTIQIEKSNTAVESFYQRLGFIPALTYDTGDRLWTVSLARPSR